MYLIYKLTNPHTELSYIGYTNDLERRIKEHKKLNTVECDDFTTEVLFDGIPTRAEANEMEKVFIDIHGTFDNGYNNTRGGGRGTEMAKFSDEHCSKISEHAKSRVKDGTHHFLGKTNPVYKHIANGTHHLLDGSIQRKYWESFRERQRETIIIIAEVLYYQKLSWLWYSNKDWSEKYEQQSLF